MLPAMSRSHKARSVRTLALRTSGILGFRALGLVVVGLLVLSASTPARAGKETAAGGASGASPMKLCTDGKKHYVGLLDAKGDDEAKLYYGDDKVLQQVAPVGAGFSEWFFEPRFYNSNNNDDFRGLDLRPYSRLELNPAKNSCVVLCGERPAKLEIVADADTKALLEHATLKPPGASRLPHALARDDRAVYYYVDRGSTKETERNFRLFVGKKGAMKLQKMTDVASDSDGQIFATKTGSLRLVVGSKESLWIAGKKRQPLLVLPVAENYRMIFTELGIYDGLRLGTPCDDL